MTFNLKTKHYVSIIILLVISNIFLLICWSLPKDVAQAALLDLPQSFSKEVSLNQNLLSSEIEDLKLSKSHMLDKISSQSNEINDQKLYIDSLIEIQSELTSYKNSYDQLKTEYDALSKQISSQNSISYTSDVITSQTSESTQIQDDVNSQSSQVNEQIQSTQTDGFNFQSYHFPIASFSGSGQVPSDGNVYQWTSKTNHYLIEKTGSAGAVIRNLTIGSTLIVNGQTYKVFDVKSEISNSDSSAYSLIMNSEASITFQTCDSYSSNSTLTLWFANKI